MDCSCIGRVCSKQAADGKRTEGAARSGVSGSNCLPAQRAFLELPARDAGERAAEGRTARAESGEGEAAVELGNAALEFLPSAAGRAACLELDLNCEKQGIALMPEERSDERQLTQPMPSTLHAVGSNVEVSGGLTRARARISPSA